MSLYCVLQLAAEHRIALVIGNAAYADTPLANPVNDATDMAAKLQTLGFAVQLETDATLRTMQNDVRSFTGKITSADTVALFYYSGHGIQYEGQNYLVPVGSDIQAVDELPSTAFNVDFLYNKLQNTAAGTNIIILDACRNNPFKGFSRSAERGLTVTIRQPSSSVIVYSTAPGQTARDGDGRNGTFTAALLRHMTDPEDIELMLRSVRDEVNKETNGEQIPWTNSSLSGTGFSFVTPESTVRGALTVTAASSGNLFFDDQPLGTFDAEKTKVFSGLAAGSHTVSLEYPDYTETKDIVIVGNGTAEASFEYTYIPDGGVTLSGWPEETVISYTDKNGQSLSQTIDAEPSSAEIDHLPEGAVTLMLQNPKWPKEIEYSIKITAGKTISLPYEMKKLIISGLPPETEVDIENDECGTTTEGRKDFTAGSFFPAEYQVKLSGPFLKTVVQNINLKTESSIVRIQPIIQILGTLRIHEEADADNGDLVVSANRTDISKSVEKALSSSAETEEEPDTYTCICTFSSSKSAELSLEPGTYTISFRHREDAAVPVTRTVSVTGGAYTDMTLPEIGWSIPYQINGLEKQKVAYENRLGKAAGQRKAFRTAGWITLGIGTAFIAGAAGSYIAGKNAYNAYENAYYENDAEQYASQAKTWSTLCSSCLITAGIACIMSPVLFCTAPNSAKIQQSIDELDRKIQLLSAEGQTK